MRKTIATALVLLSLSCVGCITDSPMFHGDGADKSPTVLEYGVKMGLVAGIALIIGLLLGKK